MVKVTFKASNNPAVIAQRQIIQNTLAKHNGLNNADVEVVKAGLQLAKAQIQEKKKTIHAVAAQSVIRHASAPVSANIKAVAPIKAIAAPNTKTVHSNKTPISTKVLSLKK